MPCTPMRALSSVFPSRMPRTAAIMPTPLIEEARRPHHHQSRWEGRAHAFRVDRLLLQREQVRRVKMADGDRGSVSGIVGTEQCRELEQYAHHFAYLGLGRQPIAVDRL